MPFVNEKTQDGQWQTADHERNIRLVYGGTKGSGSAYIFSLHYGGVKISLSAQRRMKKAANNLNDVMWDIVECNVPDELNGQITEVSNVITEALKVCGFLFSTNSVNEVTVRCLACQR